jgi:TRAP-type C4-dicarboxylate transport system substrate-binding protein
MPPRSVGAFREEFMKFIKALLASAVLLGSSFMAKAEKWDLAAAYAAGLFHTKNLVMFADDVRNSTSGKLDITVHPGGTLIKKNKDNRNAVRSGQIPAAEFLGAWYSNENPLWAIDTIPFIATSYEAARKLSDVSRGAIDKVLNAQGLKLLYSVPWPPQALYSVKPLEEMDDLKGLKFRTYSPFTSRIAQLAGAAGTEIQPPLATAFQTGRVEAMITSSSFGASNKAWDYLGYFYDTQAWLPKNFVVVSKKAWASLDANTQSKLMDAAAKAEARGWKMSEDSNSSAKKQLAEKGMKVAPPGDELAAGFKDIGKTMSDEWAEKAGADGKAVLEAFGK